MPTCTLTPQGRQRETTGRSGPGGVDQEDLMFGSGSPRQVALKWA